MTAPQGARAARRRAVRRRRLVIAGVVVAVLVVGGAVGAVALGGGDEPTEQATERPSTTTSSSSTTTTTLPVPTTVVPKSADPVVALAQQYDGFYEGTFTNSTFNTTGPATLEVRVDPVAGTMEITAEFDGDVFGGGANELRQIKGTIKITDPTSSTTTQTKSFGTVVGRIDATQAIVLTAADVPDPKVLSFELSGRLNATQTGFDATYHVVFEDQTTADGVITVTCSPRNQRPSAVPTVCAPPPQ